MCDATSVQHVYSIYHNVLFIYFFSNLLLYLVRLGRHLCVGFSFIYFKTYQKLSFCSSRI